MLLSPKIWETRDQPEGLSSSEGRSGKSLGTRLDPSTIIQSREMPTKLSLLVYILSACFNIIFCFSFLAETSLFSQMYFFGILIQLEKHKTFFVKFAKRSSSVDA